MPYQSSGDVPSALDSRKAISGLHLFLGLLTMRMTDIPFCTTDWSAVEETLHSAESGEARWRTRQFGDIRVRLVRYSAGYVADHWCSKGHILFCIEGELTTTLQDGRSFELQAGMSYQVADDTMPHRSSSKAGATLFIVD